MPWSESRENFTDGCLGPRPGEIIDEPFGPKLEEIANWRLDLRLEEILSIDALVRNQRKFCRWTIWSETRENFTDRHLGPRT